MQCTVLIVDATLLVLVPGDAMELCAQSGAFDRILARLRVHVERASLWTSRRECFALEDCGVKAVKLEDTSKRQAAGAGSDDGNARYGVLGHA
jgi:hypothetical protein